QSAFGGVCTFDNRGTVQVNSGLSLAFNGPVVQEDTVNHKLIGGTWYVAGELLLSGSSIAINQANVTLDGAGATFDAMNSLTSNQGTFAVTGGKAFTTVADLTNAGMMNVGPGSALTVTGNFTNYGTFKATGATVTFNGTFDSPGPYVSDPS